MEMQLSAGKTTPLGRGRRVWVDRVPRCVGRHAHMQSRGQRHRTVLQGGQRQESAQCAVACAMLPGWNKRSALTKLLRQPCELGVAHCLRDSHRADSEPRDDVARQPPAHVVPPQPAQEREKVGQPVKPGEPIRLPHVAAAQGARLHQGAPSMSGLSYSPTNRNLPLRSLGPVLPHSAPHLCKEACWPLYQLHRQPAPRRVVQGPPPPQEHGRGAVQVLCLCYLRGTVVPLCCSEAGLHADAQPTRPGVSQLASCPGVHTQTQL